MLEGCCRVLTRHDTLTFVAKSTCSQLFSELVVHNSIPLIPSGESELLCKRRHCRLIIVLIFYLIWGPPNHNLQQQPQQPQYTKHNTNHKISSALSHFLQQHRVFFQSCVDGLTSSTTRLHLFLCSVALHTCFFVFGLLSGGHYNSKEEEIIITTIVPHQRSRYTYPNLQLLC